MRTKKGFSIGEVLVAMFILLVGMVDAVFLTVRSVDTMKDSRDAVVATLLAQEGTELVRNVRDNSVTEMTCGSTGDQRCTAFDRTGDNDYGFPSAPFSGYCTIDYDTTGVNSQLNCSGNSSKDELFLDEDKKLYEHSGGGSSKHKLYRRIYFAYDTTDGSPANTPSHPDRLVANVTSVVIFGGRERDDFPDVNNIVTECTISEGCAFAQTRLTSWINYGD